MKTPNNDFTTKSLLEELKRLYGWNIPYITFWTWTKKKYVGPSAFIKDGKRQVPIYYGKDVTYLVNVLRLLQKTKKINIKGYDKSH